MENSHEEDMDFDDGFSSEDDHEVEDLINEIFGTEEAYVDLEPEEDSSEGGHPGKWISTPFYGGRSFVHLLLQIMVLLTGASWEKFSLGAKFINLAVGSTRQFYKMQLQYRVAIEESFARHMETVRKDVAGVPLSIAVDVRYDTPEVGDSREVGRHSPKMERLLIERGLLYLVHQSPLIVWEIISDASRNIISLLSKEAGSNSGRYHKEISLSTALAMDSTNYKPVLVELQYICRHPEGVTEIENKKWLERDSEAFKQLRKMVTNREWCGTIHFYTHCKQTWAIEKIFSHTLLHYCPKANSYSYDSYRIRNILAVMDHSNHLGRMPQVGDDGDSYAQAQVSRRTKQWVAYERKTPKDFKYIPDLMAACLHKTYGVPEKAFSKSRKSLELDKVAKNLSGDKNPGSRLLLAEMKSRKNTGTDASQ
uniref:Uncharacterized protein n=1 Tax=Magallana gigas TaxID=29159 RepID=A0A8W8LSL6_MAGGI